MGKIGFLGLRRSDSVSQNVEKEVLLWKSPEFFNLFQKPERAIEMNHDDTKARKRL